MQRSLVPRDAGVNLLTPGVNPAGHVLNLRKPLLAKELSHSQAPPTVMTMHDHASRLVPAKLSQSARDFTHWDMR